MPLAEHDLVGLPAAHTGITPCLRHGRSTLLSVAIRSAADDPRARLARVDDVVDQSRCRRRCRRRSARGPRSSIASRVASGSSEASIAERPMMFTAPSAPITEISADRPGVDLVGLVGLAVHHVVAGAVGLADHDGHLRHRRPRDRVEHLRPVADDPGVLDLRADHEPGHVLEEDERDREGVAEVDEARRLVGRVVLEDAAELLRLVGDDPDRLAAEAGEAGDDRLRELRLDVEELAVVDDLRGSRSYMSYGWRFDSGTMSSSFSDIRSSGSSVSRTGGFCSQFEGKNER